VSREGEVRVASGPRCKGGESSKRSDSSRVTPHHYELIVELIFNAVINSPLLSFNLGIHGADVLA